MIVCGNYTNETACNAAPKDECFWNYCEQMCLDNPCDPKCYCEDGSDNATTPDNGEIKTNQYTLYYY